MEDQLVQLVPDVCKGFVYALSVALSVFATVIVALVYHIKTLYNQLIKFAGRGTEALETLSKLSKLAK